MNFTTIKIVLTTMKIIIKNQTCLVALQTPILYVSPIKFIDSEVGRFFKITIII